ncbi:UNVERIFIED_CONTAM: hypothetical protein Sindi_1676700 [Sesamum indicum]
MDFQPRQNNSNEGDRLQTSESLSGFFSRMTVSNKTMERIMWQDSNLSPYDGFRIGGIGKVLNQIGLNQRKHHIIYKASEGNSIILRLRHLRENLEELDRKFGQLAVNAQVAGKIQRDDLDTVQVANKEFLISIHLAMERLNRFNSEGVTFGDDSREVQISLGSSQPSTSRVKEGEISLRPMTGTSKANTNELISSSVWPDYQRSKSADVREWYDFGALSSIHTMSPSFSEISKLPKWISGAVFDSWQNNPQLKRCDVLEIKFVSVAPETAEKGSDPAFYFMKLQRPNMGAFNKIKVASGEAPLVSAISEDSISTRRAWGLWVCLTEMDKVKYPFKIFSNKVNGSFLLNSMTGKSTEFAESLFKKRGC